MTTTTMILLPLALSVFAQDEEALRVHTKLHQKISPAIVGIRGGGRRGTGIVISSLGLILTSTTTAGARDESVEVTLKGHRRVRGSVVRRKPDLELMLVKIDAKDVTGVLELGDSDSAKLGQLCYVLGDSYNSIFTDDQVALTLGHVSGRYSVDATKGRATYKGEVIETSAGVNPNNDGAALVDATGRLIGMVTMNYHESKFTGIAIPINRLKEEIQAGLAQYRTAGWLGLTLEEKGGKIAVAKVAAKGPAEKGGLKAGDVLDSIGRKSAEGLEQANALLKACWVGEAVEVEVLREGKKIKVSLLPDAKDFY
ncbi:MAG TPA: S1C family serine protease [Planctomycetota bacterium]|nr:S1C family serine protease [Planctomycetota bacterium]